MFLQEWFFRQALEEYGIDIGDVPIQPDHHNGRNSLAGVTLPVKYPRSFMDRAQAIPQERKYNYAFSGFMPVEGGRQALLEKFVGENSFIEANAHGRDKKKKFGFNESYYVLMRSTVFALCPHQVNWAGPAETAWTYRFIEACFSRALPVVFRTAPCGALFLDGFAYFWDDEPHGLDGYDEKIEHNFRLVQERYFLGEAEAGLIREALAARKAVN